MAGWNGSHGVLAPPRCGPTLLAVHPPGAEGVAQPLGKGHDSAPHGGERLAEEARDDGTVAMPLVADFHSHAAVAFGRGRGGRRWLPRGNGRVGGNWRLEKSGGARCGRLEIVRGRSGSRGNAVFCKKSGDVGPGGFGIEGYREVAPVDGEGGGEGYGGYERMSGSGGQLQGVVGAQLDAFPALALEEPGQHAPGGGRRRCTDELVQQVLPGSGCEAPVTGRVVPSGFEILDLRPYGEPGGPPREVHGAVAEPGALPFEVVAERMRAQDGAQLPVGLEEFALHGTRSNIVLSCASNT